MPGTVRQYAVKPESIILTPPTARVAVVDARRRKSKKGFFNLRALAIAEPTRAHLLVGAAVYWAVPWILARLEGIPLPLDRLFSSVPYLMWSGPPAESQRLAPLFAGAIWLHFAAAAALVCSAFLPHQGMFKPVHTVGRRFYKYALALPLWTLITAGLARFVSDQVSSSTGIMRWDFTPTVAKLETPFIEWFQHALASPALTASASNFYSAMWLAPLALAGFILVAADKPRLMNSLTLAYVLTLVLALPLFVLVPTFDPWTTNAIYGARGLTTHIRYLSANPPLSLLTQVNTQLHWSAGAAFPSVQIAFPLVVSLVLRRHGMKALSLVMMGLAAMTMFVSVYLGRHWVIDAIAAIPFSFAVVALGSRIPFSVMLGRQHTPRSALRPGEVAVPSNRTMDAVQWLAAVCLICGLAMLLYQVSR